MFNIDDRKQRYINFLEDDKYLQQTISRFNKTSSMEFKLNKDLCDFTIAEIADMYRLFNTTSIQYLIVLNNFYYNYASWCLAQTLIKDNQNHFAEVTNELLSLCINQNSKNNRLFSRTELLDQLDEVLNPADQFLILGTFEGIYKESFGELFLLTLDDFNYEEKTVKTCAGRIVDVSDELIAIAKRAAATYTYQVYSDNDSRRYDSLDYFPDDGKIIVKKTKKMTSDYTNEPSLFAKRYTKIMIKIRNYTGRYYTGKTLINSGCVDAIKKFKAKGDYSTYEECILDNYGYIAYKYGNIQQLKNFIKINNLRDGE